jgi:hypothetical protein
MGTASVPLHGFVAVRGRDYGYRPAQVDYLYADLCRERDEAWERAARLTVLAREMEEETARLGEAVARLPPQTYGELGERAYLILRAAEEEAAELRASAFDEARALRDAVEQEVCELELRDKARTRADEVHAEARARQMELAAQRVAEGVRAQARKEAEEVSGEALAVLHEMRQRTAAMLTALENEQVERWAALEHDIAEREAEAETDIAVRAAGAETGLAQARRAWAEAEEFLCRRQLDAEKLGAEIVAEAHVAADRIARETERVLRKHAARREELQSQMDHVRAGFAALTGHAPAGG